MQNSKVRVTLSVCSVNSLNPNVVSVSYLTYLLNEGVPTVGCLFQSTFVSEGPVSQSPSRSPSLPSTSAKSSWAVLRHFSTKPFYSPCHCRHFRQMDLLLTSSLVTFKHQKSISTTLEWWPSSLCLTIAPKITKWYLLHNIFFHFFQDKIVCSSGLRT